MHVRSQILALTAAALTTAAAADELDASRKHPSSLADLGAEPRVIVKLHSDDTTRVRVQSARDTVQSVASRTGVRAKRIAPLGKRLHVMEIEPDESIESTLARLQADSAVEYAELDRRRYLHAVPDDLLYAQQWYLQGTSVAPSAIDAEHAWDITTGSDGVVVAFLDSGVLYDHPDLLSAGVGGRLLPGYDFVSSVAAANDGDGRDADATDAGDWVTAQDRQSSTFAGCQVTASSWHGTRVAGIIGARSNNATGIAGATWQPWLLPLRVVGKCGGRDSDILAAMLWAAGIHVDGVPDNPYPAKVLNLSFGSDGSCSQAYQDVIEQIAERGTVAVISAGNEGGPVASPANCVGVVAVGGLRHVGTKVGYSSLGRQVTVSAPAGNCVNTTGACLYSIVTVTNTGTTTPATHSYTDQFNFNVGTSFSAPIVSGIAALMASVNENLDSSRLLERLQEGATKPFPSNSSLPQCHVPISRADIQDSECNCTTDTCGAGMANASGALAAALRPVAEVTVSGAFTPGGSIELSGLASVAAAGRSVVAYHWSLPCGSGNFTAADSAVTVVGVPAAESFTLRLAVTDDAGRVDRADVVVTPTGATRSPGTAPADGCAPIEVTVSPATSSMQTHAMQTFTATVANAADTTVTWQVNGVVGGNATVGTISATGLYTAPAGVPSPATVTVSAVSNQDATRSDSATVTISSVLETVAVPTSSDGGSGAIDTAALLALLVAALGRRKRDSVAALKRGCR